MIKRGVMLALMLVLVSFSCCGFFPSEYPGATIGFDYHLTNPRNTYWLIGLYDGTTVYMDTSLNGIYSQYTTLNKLGTSSISSSYGLSAKIHATKPILMSVLADRDSCVAYACQEWGYGMLPAQSLVYEYYVAHPMSTGSAVYITSTQSGTNLLIDKTNDGTWDTNTTLLIGTSYSYGAASVQAGSRIKTNKPVYVVQLAYYESLGSGGNDADWGFEMWNASGTDFYIGYPNTIIYIVAYNAPTMVEFDTNDDGIFDSSTTLSKMGTYNSSGSFPVSTRIHANNSILVTGRRENSESYLGILLPPAKQLGQEYRVNYVEDTYGVAWIVATKSNTNLLIDKTDDGTWDVNTTINPGTTYSYDTTYIQSGSRIKADKPIIAAMRAEWGENYDYREYGYLCPTASVATTSDASPSPTDFNTLVNISNKVWNMVEPVYNITISGSIPSNFTPWPDTNTLNITIGIYNTSNILVGGSEELAVGLVSGVGSYNYTFSYQNTTLLSQLNQSNYIKFTFQVTSPNATSTFLFNPFTVNIAQATVWKYTWE